MFEVEWYDEGWQSYMQYRGLLEAVRVCKEEAQKDRKHQWRVISIFEAIG